ELVSHASQYPGVQPGDAAGPGCRASGFRPRKRSGRLARLARRRTARHRRVQQVRRGLAAAMGLGRAEGAEAARDPHRGARDRGKRVAPGALGSDGLGLAARLRSLLFNCGFFLVTAALGVLALPLLLAPRPVVMRFGRFWAHSVLVLLKATVGLDCEIRGLGRL